MALITVEGIKVYAYHGHLKEESILGGHFLVNVWVDVNTNKVEGSDNLADTIDYVKIIKLVKEQMLIRANMIEVPANKIAEKIIKENNVIKVTVELEKVRPPVPAEFKKISVTKTIVK
jgi:dihydroneopterin aldolase